MLRMILVVAIFGAGTVVGMRSVLWAACLWIWNDIFRPLDWARYFGPLGSSLAKPVHLCTAVLLFAVFFTRWPKRWNFACGAVLFLVLWVWICTAFAQYPEIALAQAIKTSKYMLPLIPIGMALCYRRAQEIFLYVLAGSVGLWLVHHGVKTVLEGQPLIYMAIPAGQMTDRNDFLVGGVACMPLMGYMGWHYRGYFQTVVRWACRIGLAFSVGAIFYSHSRGAMVGLAILFVWYAFATGRPLKRLAIAGVLVLAMLPLVPESTWERMSTIQLEGPQTESSARNRMEHMATAVRVSFEYPLFGCGPNCFPSFSRNYGRFTAEPHSLWLKGSSEYGLLFFAFFVYFTFRTLGRLYGVGARARKEGDRRKEAMATALSCGLIGFLGTGSFTSQFLSQYLWAILVVAGAFLRSPDTLEQEDATKDEPMPRKAANEVPAPEDVSSPQGVC